MEGFALPARRGSYAEDGARPRAANEGSRRRARDGQLNIGPGYTKCLGECRPVVLQDHVRGGFPLATGDSRRRADGRQPDVFLNLSARAEPLVPKFQEERKQAAEGEPYEPARETKYFGLRRSRRG